MIDFKDFNENISDEMLAAYIEGNATPTESLLIESSLESNSTLSAILDVAQDAIEFEGGRSMDWDVHKGDFGFWELGLPPLVNEADLAIAADFADTQPSFDASEDTINFSVEENFSMHDDSFLDSADSIDINSEFDSSDMNDDDLDEILVL